MHKDLLKIKKIIGMLSIEDKANENDIKSVLKEEKGYIEINGTLFKADAIYKYKTKKELWHEIKLINMTSLEVSYLEIYEDDVLELSISHENEKLSPAKAGINLDAVEEISENESGSILLKKKNYFYEDDYKLKFISDKGEQKFFVYEFEAEDGDTLSIEEWDEGDGNYSYDIYISYPVDESTVKVY